MGGLYDWSSIFDHTHSYLGCTRFRSGEDRRHSELDLQLEKWRKSRSDWIGNIQRFVRPVRKLEHCNETYYCQNHALEKKKEAFLSRENRKVGLEFGAALIFECRSTVLALPECAGVALGIGGP